MDVFQKSWTPSKYHLSKNPRIFDFETPTPFFLDPGCIFHQKRQGIGLFKEAFNSPVGLASYAEPSTRFILGRLSWLLGMLVCLGTKQFVAEWSDAFFGVQNLCS